MKLTVALAQIPVSYLISENLVVIQSALKYAADHKADILLTPEGSLSGYTHDFNRQDLNEALQILEADILRQNVGLALGTCKYEEDGLCYNELRFYSKHGEFLGMHTKTLLCGTLEEDPLGEINEYSRKPLQVVKFAGITIGGLICNDMWGNPYCTPMPDPHLAHSLSNMGAKIIFHAVNGGRTGSEFSQGIVKRFHESNILMNAGANKLFIVTVDNSFPENIPVSSIGGVAGPDAKWLYRLNDTGCQYGVFTVNLE